MNVLDKNDVVNYFFSLDPNRELFNQKLITRNGASFYEGNARLNKYLHLSQNIYLAMTGKPLMDASFYAYSNGAVVPSIQKDYRLLSATSKNADVSMIPAETKLFLKRVFIAFQYADIDEIIEIDHEDEAWIEKSREIDYESQKIDSLKYVEEYKEQYADMIKVLGRMDVCL